MACAETPCCTGRPPEAHSPSDFVIALPTLENCRPGPQPLSKAAYLAKNHPVPREPLAIVPAGEVASVQAQCWRQGGGVQLQQASGVSRHRDRGHFGGGDDLPLRECLVPVTPA